MAELNRLLAPFRAELALLAEVCAREGVAAWVVGGTLRDALAGRPIHDVDLVVIGSALTLAREVADRLGATCVPLDAEHDIARIALVSGDYLDLAGARSPTIAGDLAARDFTVNALAAPLELDGTVGALLDPLGGAADIAASRLRLCAASALIDDPLRILRAARLGAKLGWTLDPGLDAAIRQAAPLLAGVAAERIRQELLALLSQRWSAPWLRYLDRAGVLELIVPEIGPLREDLQGGWHYFKVWEHSLEAVCCGEWLLASLAGDARPGPAGLPPAERADPYPPAFFINPVALATQRDLSATLQWSGQVLAHFAQPISREHDRAALWKLALLLHDVAKPAVRAIKPDGGISYYDHQIVGAEIALEVGERLRLSKAEAVYVAKIVRGHMRPGQLHAEGDTSARAAYRFFRDLGAAAVDTLIHALADHLATRGPGLAPHGWATHLAWTDAMLGFHLDAQQIERRKPLVDGHRLMTELNLAPGPQIGSLLEALREAQAAGEITSLAEALALARRLDA